VGFVVVKEKGRVVGIVAEGGGGGGKIQVSSIAVKAKKQEELAIKERIGENSMP